MLRLEGIAPGWVSVDRRVLQVLIDMAAWGLAIFGATWARWDFALEPVYGLGLVLAATTAACCQVAAGYLTGLYRGQRRFGSFDEVAVLAPATAVTTVVLFWVVLGAGMPRLVPLSVPLVGGVTAFLLMGATRYAWRLRLDRLRRPTGDDVARVLVFGAGEGGAQVMSAMLRDPSSPYLPVALLDDSPRKQRLRIMGVPVLGDRTAVGEVGRTRAASVLLIAIPSADATLVGELTDAATEAGLSVLVLPPVSDLIGGRAGLGDIRALTESDLLGRHEIDTDIASIADYLRGRRVLVTGAGGSIGSELCRQIHRFAPAELIKLDRDESALHAVQLSIEGRALLDGGELILLDIRDRRTLRELFERRRPEVVFHAAALKHLPLLEQFPAEGLRTNVLATLDLLRLSQEYGVDRFVNVSTDKAADPISVLGYTKRLAERLTAHVAREASGTFLSVRFGNVLGSRGSVLTAFRAQLEAGGPITVTDPDVTRYFMTVEEAVQLVIQAGALAQPGEALVLDMGAPVRIASVAERLAAQSDRPVQIVYTGLRPGEKLQEVLLGEGERDLRPIHPLISHVDVPPCDPGDVLQLDPWSHADDLVPALVQLAYQPPRQADEPALGVTAC
jgi:FlaA1/EpsC-like NDP-sugar epimerase